MEGDKDAVVNYNVAWTASSRLCNLSSDREDTVCVGDQPPDGITSLERRTLGTLDTLELLKTHSVRHQPLVFKLNNLVRL